MSTRAGAGGVGVASGPDLPGPDSPQSGISHCLIIHARAGHLRRNVRVWILGRWQRHAAQHVNGLLVARGRYLVPGLDLEVRQEGLKAQLGVCGLLRQADEALLLRRGNGCFFGRLGQCREGSKAGLSGVWRGMAQKVLA